MRKIFVKKDLNIPEEQEFKNYKLKKLTVEYVEKDYKAVMSSKKHLRTIFSSNDSWPKDDMTIEENYNDLKEHQEEFDSKIAFTYTVLSLDESECLGCVYIYPPVRDKTDARVYLWATQEKLEEGFEEVMLNDIENWLKNYWQMKNIDFPGRKVSWEDWRKIISEFNK